MLTEEEIRNMIGHLTSEGLVGFIIGLQEEARSEGWQDGYTDGYNIGYEEGERIYY